MRLVQRIPGPVRIALTALTLITVSLVLHRSALERGFSVDDPWILRCAVFESALGLLFDPAAYQHLNAIFFTPMGPLSLALDHALFGLEPSWFYVHQVVSLGLVACGIFAVVRPRGVAIAWLAAGLFLVSGPAAICARLLMTRHHVEGAIFALAAVWLLQTARGPGLRVVFAAALLLVAMICKELYVPLGIAVPLFLRGTWRERLRLSWPILVAMAIYAVWRLWMVGGLGGYTTVGVTDALAPDRFWRGVCAVGAMLGGDSPADGSASLVACAVLGVCAATAWRVLATPQRWGWLALVALAAVPMLLVWGLLERESTAKYRLVIHLAVIAPVAIGWAMPRRGALSRLLVGAGFVAVVGLGLVQSRLVEHFDQVQRVHDREAEFLWSRSGMEDGVDVVLLNQAALLNRHAIAELRDRLLAESTPRICNVPFDLRHRPARYYQYRSEQDDFVDFTPQFLAARRVLTDRLGEQSFAVEVDIRDGGVECRLDDGESRGQYFMLQGNEPGLYETSEIPPLSRYKFAILHYDTYFRFVRISADGAVVMSPEWRASLAQDAEFRWRR